MAKWKKTTVGSIVKGKDGKPDYLKIRDTVTLNKGDILNLESQKTQVTSLEKAIADGKLSGEFAEKLLERAKAIPDWVRFEVTKSEKQE